MPTSPAHEAWGLFWQIFIADKPRRMAVFNELGLAFQQAGALMRLEPGGTVTMSELATHMMCDNSNVTGIVDRLEALGLAERRPLESDRRVRTVVLTERGEEVRASLMARAGVPPPEIAGLSDEDAIALRDILRRATAAVAAHA